MTLSNRSCTGTWGIYKKQWLEDEYGQIHINSDAEIVNSKTD